MAETIALYIASTKPDSKNPASQWAATNSVKLETFDDVTAKDKRTAEKIWKELHQNGITLLEDFLPKTQAEEVGSEEF